MTRRFGWMLALLTVLLAPLSLSASDWTNWRGPFQNGYSPDKNLPDKFEGNILWKAPYGCRSTPLVLNGNVYVINYDSEKIKAGGTERDNPESIQERVMCLDANTGKMKWQHDFPVFHTDIVTVRLGWTNLAADAATGYIYAHGTQGLFFCLDGKTGKVVWSKSMSEEFGRITGYGGRVTTPTVDEDLVILGMVNSSWGSYAKGANRFVAMDKLTGKIMWWSEPAGPVKDTYYSVPCVATINGQRLLISGGADGGVFAMKIHTGEPVWRFTFGRGAVNCAPVVEGNFVYIGQGEENNDSNVQGTVLCLDASKIEKGEPKLVWRADGIKERYTSPIIHEGLLYVTDEIGKLYCLDAKTGKQLWKYSYGRNSRGSPVLADGKIFVGEVNSRFHILEPGPKKCRKLDDMYFPSADGTDVELNGSPAIANGRVYFSTSDEILCLGTKAGMGEPAKLPAPPKAAPGKIAHLQIVPAEVAVNPGQSVTFTARAYDANGNFVKDVQAEYSLPAPTPPPGVKANPPALKGAITPDGKLTVDAKVPNQGSIVVGKADGLTAIARVRVVPKLPYFNDFEKIPDGAAPGGWVNTQGKFLVKTVNGNKVLAKVNDKASPLIAIGNAYITLATAKDYTIECDVQGSKVGDDMPDMGIVANRYSLILAGGVQKLRLVSWNALPRIDKTIQFNWQPDTWYRLKLTVEMVGTKGIIRGKVWDPKQKEPAAWTIEVTDSYPIHEGSAALYGNVAGVLPDRPGTEIYYDNLRITPNATAGKNADAGKTPPTTAASESKFVEQPQTTAGKNADAGKTPPTTAANESKSAEQPQPWGPTERVEVWRTRLPLFWRFRR